MHTLTPYSCLLHTCMREHLHYIDTLTGTHTTLHSHTSCWGPLTTFECQQHVSLGNWCAISSWTSASETLAWDDFLWTKMAVCSSLKTLTSCVCVMWESWCCLLMNLATYQIWLQIKFGYISKISQKSTLDLYKIIQIIQKGILEIVFCTNCGS